MRPTQHHSHAEPTALVLDVTRPRPRRNPIQALPRIGFNEPVRVRYVCKSDVFVHNRVATATESGRMNDGTVHVVLKGSFSRGTVL